MNRYGIIGFRINCARRVLKMSQRTLASRLKVTQAFLSMVEAGKRDVSTAMLCRLADELNVSADALLGRTELFPA